MTDYCTIDDIELHLSTPTLTQLTSDDGQEAINRDVAQESILYASTLIDGYLRGRYSLPLNTLSFSPALNGVTGSDEVAPVQPLPASRFPLLRILAIDLSVHRLYSRRTINDMPEVIEQNYKNAISTLRDIQKGVITLQSANDLFETSGFNPDEYRTNKTIIDRLFGKDRMLEY